MEIRNHLGPQRLYCKLALSKYLQLHRSLLCTRPWWPPCYHGSWDRPQPCQHLWQCTRGARPPCHLALFHINSNFFNGTLRRSFNKLHLLFSFNKLHLLFELHISTNLFSGKFPFVVVSLPSLKFLHIRFNRFGCQIPPRLFDLKLDGLFINNNLFQSSLPRNFGNYPVSVVVLANNKLGGCLPTSDGKMGWTLNEIVLANVHLNGCLPP